jgi:hypothetical protein
MVRDTGSTHGQYRFKHRWDTSETQAQQTQHRLNKDTTQAQHWHNTSSTLTQYRLKTCSTQPLTPKSH